MEVSYYPGCSLHGLSSEYDESVREVCRKLGIRLRELEDWNCCGSSSAHFADDELATLLPARNAAIAEKAGLDLLVPCAACFQRLKHADMELKKDGARWGAPGYEGKASIFHVNEFFDRPELIKSVKEKTVKLLTGLSGVCYYGCLSQRPPEITGSRDCENPVSMDRLLKTVGMTVVPWSYKTECCGGSLTMARADIVQRLGGRLFEAAHEAGAECVVTDCPMCQTNLDTTQAEIEAKTGKRFGLPVFYVTEVMALALGIETGPWWKKHFTDPRPLLLRKHLL